MMYDVSEKELGWLLWGLPLYGSVWDLITLYARICTCSDLAMVEIVNEIVIVQVLLS